MSETKEDAGCAHGLALDMHCCACRRSGFFPPDDCSCFSPLSADVQRVRELDKAFTEANERYNREDLTQAEDIKAAHALENIDELRSREFESLCPKLAEAVATLTEELRLVEHVSCDGCGQTIKGEASCFACLNGMREEMNRLTDQVATLTEQCDTLSKRVIHIQTHHLTYLRETVGPLEDHVATLTAETARLAKALEDEGYAKEMVADLAKGNIAWQRKQRTNLGSLLATRTAERDALLKKENRPEPKP